MYRAKSDVDMKRACEKRRKYAAIVQSALFDGRAATAAMNCTCQNDFRYFYCVMMHKIARATSYYDVYGICDDAMMFSPNGYCMMPMANGEAMSPENSNFELRFSRTKRTFPGALIQKELWNGSVDDSLVSQQ